MTRQEQNKRTRIVPYKVTYATPVGTVKFFGVFDGHGGKSVKVDEYVSGYLRDHLFTDYIQPRLTSEVQSERDIIGLLMQAFNGANDVIKKNLAAKRLANGKDVLGAAYGTLGSTAITCLEYNGKAYIANVGDSRAVLCSGNQAIALSIDHKPNLLAEKERIIASGGLVEQSNYEGEYRVFNTQATIEKEGFHNTHLATSRAFGDLYLEKLLIATPDVHAHTVSPNDRFIILASDGLWDLFTNVEVAARVAKHLESNKDDYTGAARALIDAAQKADRQEKIQRARERQKADGTIEVLEPAKVADNIAKDNITVVVIPCNDK